MVLQQVGSLFENIPVCAGVLQFQPRGEFAWKHLAVHVVQELKPGMVIRTAETDRPRVKDLHEQDPVSRTRDLHGAIGGATMRLHHERDAPTCSQARKLTSPRGLNL